MFEPDDGTSGPAENRANAALYCSICSDRGHYTAIISPFGDMDTFWCNCAVGVNASLASSTRGLND